MSDNKKEIQPRKYETRLKTNEPQKYIGFYLAKAAQTTYYEDFIDESTGETVSIERHQLLRERGAELTQEDAQYLAFYIQSEDLKEIEVSNQERRGVRSVAQRLKPYKVTMRYGDSGKFNLICQANCVENAILVAEDFMEQSTTTSFDVTAVKEMSDMVILNDSVKTLKEVEDKDPDKTDNRLWYKVKVCITTIDEDNADNTSFNTAVRTGDFVVRTENADTAKAAIRAWIEFKLNQRNEEEETAYKLVELTTVEAAPLSCNAIINREFCMAYAPEETEQE